MLSERIIKTFEYKNKTIVKYYKTYIKMSRGLFHVLETKVLVYLKF